jgi:hypothetical protein
MKKVTISFYTNLYDSISEKTALERLNSYGLKSKTDIAYMLRDKNYIADSIDYVDYMPSVNIKKNKRK